MIHASAPNRPRPSPGTLCSLPRWHRFLPLPAAAAGGEEKPHPVIDIDGTVLIQFAIFVVMYFVLRQFLLRLSQKM